MSEENMSDSYEVGYGKPPKGTQFKKGVSGNPKGRPRKAQDFHHELLREFRSSITINENGRRHRISKYSALAKQMTIKALSGNIPALRACLDHYQIAIEKEALREASQSSGPKKHDLDEMTDEQLLEIIHAKRNNREQEMT
jgi:Family of unknown function (DUF5681)